MDRGDPVDQINDSIDEINEEAAPSSVKKKFKKIKEERLSNDEIEDDEEQQAP